MTIQGAIAELQILFNAKDIPIYYKGTIKEITETIQMDTVPKDFHDKTCEAMAKRHTEEIQRLMPKRGEWVQVFDDRHRLLKVLKCNLCGAENHFFIEDERNFCPNCGADMRKESE